jgi:hypothetical protein
VGWPHIVSTLDASLDLVTTAALSLLAQEANRSASPAHICSHLFPSPPHLRYTILDDNRHHSYYFNDTRVLRYITKISSSQHKQPEPSLRMTIRSPDGAFTRYLLPNGLFPYCFV